MEWQKPFSFDWQCIASKKFTNTAARVIPMKSAPNVFPRSRLSGERFGVEEDIVNWPIYNPNFLAACYIYFQPQYYLQRCLMGYLPILGCRIEAMWCIQWKPQRIRKFKFVIVYLYASDWSKSHVPQMQIWKSCNRIRSYNLLYRSACFMTALFI